MKVWCLFSVANEYSQPDNNLEAIFKTKPNFLQLLKQFTEQPIEEVDSELIIDVVSVLKGEEVRIDNADYRIEEIEVIE